MKNFSGNPEDPFADIFSDEETAAFNKEEEERKKAEADSYSKAMKESREQSKNAPLSEDLIKIPVNNIYENLKKIAYGQELDRSSVAIYPDLNEIFDALGFFESEEGFSLRPEQLDLFEFLKEYDLAKNNVKLKQQFSEEKLDQVYKILVKKGYDMRHQRLAIALDILSELVHKDVIKDILDRNNLEKTASILTEEISKLNAHAQLCSKILDELREIEKYKDKKNIKKEITPWESALVTKIINNLKQVLAEEIIISNDKEYGHDKKTFAAEVKDLIGLEEIVRIISNDSEKLFNANIFGFIEKFLDKRHLALVSFEKDYDEVEEKLRKYST
jgi:hypothetical protein